VEIEEEKEKEEDSRLRKGLTTGSICVRVEELLFFGM